MGNGLNRVFEIFQSALDNKKNRATVARPAADQTAGPVDLAKGGGGAAPVDPPKRPPIEIKIESTRCDLHPLYVLKPVSIEVVLPGSGVPTQVAASRCPKAGCNRHYIQEYGYFPFVSGETSDFGSAEGKLPCSVHVDSYMALAKANGNFTWACLKAGCTQATPYQAV